MNKERYEKYPWIIRKIIDLYWSLQWLYFDIKIFLFPKSSIFKKVKGGYAFKEDNE